MNFLLQNKYWFFVGIFIFLSIATLWKVINYLGRRGRGRRRVIHAGKRKSDQVVLSRHEKRMLKDALKLIEVGKITAAARIYEQIGFHREAIETLENNGLIHEAAKILLRMGKPNRAGVIYARHGLWEHATKCFKAANMPSEAAKCAKESGDLNTAAEFFEIAGRLEEAGDSRCQLGQIKKAAELYLRVGAKIKASAMYHQLGLDTNISAIPFSPEELQFISDCLTDKEIFLNKSIDGMALILCQHNAAKEVIQKLVMSNYLRPALSIFRHQKIDFGLQIIAEINFQSDQPSKFGEFFIEAQMFQYAGVIYEKAQKFITAAECFEKAEDIERAKFCYERAGLYQKAAALQRKTSRSTKNEKMADLEGIAQFSISSISQMTTPPPSLESLEEPTQILSIKQNSNYVRGNDEERFDSASNERLFSSPLESMPRLESVSNENMEHFELVPVSSSDTRTSSPPPVNTEDLVSFSAIPVNHADAKVSPIEVNPSVQEIFKIFRSIKFLQDLNDSHFDTLWKISISKLFRAQEQVLTYGAEPLGIYVIIIGKINCFRMVNNQETFLDQMVAGEGFGELWLLTDTPSSVKFTAATDVYLCIIPRTSFNEFLDNDGTVARKVYKRFTTRLLKGILTSDYKKEKKVAS